MPWFLVEVEEKSLTTYRVQARTAKAARTAFEANGPDEYEHADGGETEYTIVSVEPED